MKDYWKIFMRDGSVIDDPRAFHLEHGKDFIILSRIKETEVEEECLVKRAFWPWQANYYGVKLVKKLERKTLYVINTNEFKHAEAIVEGK